MTTAITTKTTTVAASYNSTSPLSLRNAFYVVVYLVGLDCLLFFVVVAVVVDSFRVAGPVSQSVVSHSLLADYKQ